MNWQAPPRPTVPDAPGDGSVDAARLPRHDAIPGADSRPRSSLDPEALLTSLVGEHPERLVHVHEVPARTARTADWPDWVEPTVLGALLGAGITSPWSHQVEVAEAAHAGEHVVVSTGTASGKSLGYLLPVL